MMLDQSSTSDGSHGLPSAVASAGRTGRRAPRHAGDRSQQVLREVDAVDRHVEQVARAGQVLVLPPAPARFGPVEKSLAAKVPRLAERAAGDQVLQVPHRRREAVGERRHVDDARVAGRVIHRAHFAGVQPERLLAHDVLAVPGGRHGDRRGA